MSFGPVYGPGSRALILGSWPSPKSREMGFYYGHPNNRFWPMLASLCGAPVPAREDIPAKQRLILDHGLALWDVLASCTITGASDASIRDPVPNDFAALLEVAPHSGSVLQWDGSLEDVHQVCAACDRPCGGAAAQHQPGQRCLSASGTGGNMGRSAGTLDHKKQMIAKL